MLKSYAKINLTLNVTDKLSNGYHLLDSLMSYIDLYDEIDIKQNDIGRHQIFVNSDQVSKFGSGVIEIHDNLIYRSISRFEIYYNITKPKYFSINHKKNIPIGAGLGGGSSNAAVVFNYLYDTYGIRESLENKIKIIKDLGADIPFFLTGNSKYVSGIGEILGNDCFFPNLPILLVKPPISLLTKDVFQILTKDMFRLEQKERVKSLDVEEIFNHVSNLGNDLRGVAQTLCAEIKEILDVKNNKIDFISEMSGSGPTCFFLFQNEEGCYEMKKILENRFPGFFILKTSLLNRVLVRGNDSIMQ